MNDEMQADMDKLKAACDAANAKRHIRGEHPCRVCGAPIVESTGYTAWGIWSIQGNNKTCSEKCKKAWQRIKPKRLCAYCNAPLSPLMRVDAKFCSSNCRVMNKRYDETSITDSPKTWRKRYWAREKLRRQNKV